MRVIVVVVVVVIIMRLVDRIVGLSFTNNIPLLQQYCYWDRYYRLFRFSFLLGFDGHYKCIEIERIDKYVSKNNRRAKDMR